MPFRITALWLLGLAIGFGQIIQSGDLSRVEQYSILSRPPDVAAASGKRFKVSGTVVNAVTGEPVPKALVTGPGVRAMSDGSGNFEAADVPEGNAFFSAQRPGFFPEGAGFGNYRPGKPATINDSNKSVKIKLVPGGAIHGRVVSNDGDPLEGIQVQISTQMMMNGRKQWRQSGAATTDDTGTFAFEDQMPGQYLLHTLPSRIYIQPADLEINGEHLPELYPASYYPNAPDRESAQSISILPGSQAQADFTLTAVPGYSISGTVAGAPRAFVSCEGSSGEIVSRYMQNNFRNGQFSITGVPSGTCKLVARTPGGNGSGMVAEQEVRVASADITGIQLQMTEAIPDIPITVTGQPQGTPAPGANISLLPQSDSLGRMNTFVSARPGQNGVTEQVIHNPTPGRYRLMVNVFGNACVASMLAGGTDLMKEELVISRDAPSPPIVVTLRSDCGAITGHIDGVATNAPTFIIIAGAGQPARQQFASGGNLTLNNLSPGDYTLYAFDDISNLEYANPEAMKGFEAQHVSVNAGDKATVQLKLLKTGSSSTPALGESR